MFGHGLATVLPAIGPAAANAGEMIGSGDIAGGLGAAAGVLAPTMVSGVRGTPPAKAVANRLHGRAVEQYSQALNPTRIDTKVQTARIAPEALKRRVTATSLQKLEDLAETQSAKAGQKVGETYAPHLDDATDTMALVEKLEEAKNEYRDTATDGHTVNTVPERVDAIQKLQDKLMEYGDTISVRSRVKLRRNWDEIVNNAKGFVTEDVGVKGWAAREGRSVLRENLMESVPDINAINADYSFWQSLEDVAHASNERKTGQKKNLVTTIAGGAGAVAAEIAMPGGGVVKGGLQAALGAQLFSSLRKLLDSPGYQMWSAVQKEKLADALFSRDSARVRGLVHQGLVSAAAGSRAAGRVQSGVEHTKPAAENERQPRDQRVKR
jgi:flagellar biosynthesis chaperone FliJ